MREPAELGWCAALGGLIAFDVWLARTERALLTHIARKHKKAAMATLCVFGLHVLDVLGPCDPFNVIGSLATKGIRK